MSLKEEYNEKKKELAEDYSEAKEKVGKAYESGKKATKKFFKRLFLALAGLAVLGAIGFFLWANYTYSEGSRTGYLIKMSRKGNVLKTYEGQLNLGGFKAEGDDSNIIGNVWNFSVKEEFLYKELGELEGKKVTIKYREKKKALPWQGDTPYFVYDVEVKE